MIQPVIYISEKNGTRELQIPWIPEEIRFTSNGTRFASYDVMGRGEVKLPAGANIHGYAWDGILPGKERLSHCSIPRYSTEEPKRIQGLWSQWREYGTPLCLLVTGTPINHDVYLEDYDIRYAGAFGDYAYSISFIDAREISVTVDTSGRASGKTTEKTAGTSTGNNSTGNNSVAEAAKSVQRPETQSATTSYTTTDSDTLWGIATRFLGDGTRWTEIYNLNRAVIESTAKAHGFPSSSNGHWIFGGMKLQIKK